MLSGCCSLQRFILGCLPLSRQSNTVGNYDLQRAAMVKWLTTHDFALDIQAVNAKLETGLHCALQTQSSATLQVSTPTDPHLLPHGWRL